MCKKCDDARATERNNLERICDAIEALDIPCRYKTAFISVVGIRGLRFLYETLQEMEAIGKTDSDVLIHQIVGKSFGLIVPYILAISLETDKERAEVIQYMLDNGHTINERNVLKDIWAVRRGMANTLLSGLD